MMDNFELEKEKYHKTSVMLKRAENPVIQTLLDCLGIIPVVGPIASAGGELASSGLKAALEKKQNEKLEQICGTIAADASITLEDVQDVNTIFEFAQLLKTCETLSSNRKVQYLTGLFCGSIHEKQPDVFEEEMDKLTSLSIREIEFLFEFYKIQEENRQPLDDGIGFNVHKTWEMVQKHFNETQGMNETEVLSMASGIQRTGFVLVEWRMVYNEEGVFAYVTPSFGKVAQKIEKER